VKSILYDDSDKRRGGNNMCHSKLINQIHTKFQTRTSKERPYIVALDGLSGAGKTTLVTNLESELKNICNVVVIHIDDHIVERNQRYNTGYDEWYEYYYLQWDVEMLREELFNKLHSNNPKLTLPFYEKSIDNIINKTISIEQDSIILIEGIFLQRKEWKAYYDFTVFIDCPREIRYERVLRRDTYIGDQQARLDKYKRRYWPGEDHYLETEKPIKNADKVYENIS
jgi:uridine kinase